MNEFSPVTDTVLVTELSKLTRKSPLYWSYSASSRAQDSYDYFQYPAMMVPSMLRDLTSIITEVDPKVRTIYDPFAGSGSVLTEAMFQGLGFAGADINPLAILLCKVRSGPFREEMLEDRGEDLIDAIESDSSSNLEADFPGIKKWFNAKAIKELSRIRRAIRMEPSLWCRRFFWVSLAETVRLCSNSRTSTFKLHTRANA